MWISFSSRGSNSRACIALLLYVNYIIKTGNFCFQKLHKLKRNRQKKWKNSFLCSEIDLQSELLKIFKVKHLNS